jgi:hypothetical protein
MSKASLLVTQGGADTFTAGAIDTGLTADGKAGWQINAIRAFWVDGAAVAAADHSISAKLSTIATTTTFGSADEIDRVAWGLQNTAGVAVAVPYEPVKEHFLTESRVTVQPNIYVQVESAGTGQANDVILEIFYDVVKLSDIEVLRLLAGGA